jgi:hypothetical protein
MLLQLQIYIRRRRVNTSKSLIIRHVTTEAQMSTKKSSVMEKDVSETEMLEDTRVSDEKIDEIRQHTVTDPKLQKVMQYTMSEWPTKFNSEINEYHKNCEEFASCGGLLIKVDRIVYIYIVPETLRAKLLDCLHRAHNGVVATLRLAKDSLFYPGITNYIKRKVSQCEACRKYDGNSQRESMKSMPIPELPYEQRSMNIFEHETKNYLVAVDHSTLITLKLTSCKI